MEELTSSDRLMRIIEGKEIDRIATYDIIHDLELRRYLTGDKITPKNAEDIACKAVGKVLDVVRHFSIPYSLELKIGINDNLLFSPDFILEILLPRTKNL